MRFRHRSGLAAGEITPSAVISNRITCFLNVDRRRGARTEREEGGKMETPKEEERGRDGREEGEERKGREEGTIVGYASATAGPPFLYAGRQHGRRRPQRRGARHPIM